jgi:isoquinoline 1-oxidoreductase alpha subunit
MLHTLNLNGGEVAVEADPAMPLLFVLRDLLQLCGTKYGCGMGQCGVCTVLVDGVPQRSCQLPVGGLQDQAIVTIEGIGRSGPDPVVQAFTASSVPQCGYCQPAQVLTACALRARNPAPQPDQIDQAFDAVLCRCGTYPRIRAAIGKVLGR